MATAWEQQSLYDRFVGTRQVQMEREKQPFLATMAEIVDYLRPDLTGNTETDVGKQMGEIIVEGTGHFDAATLRTWFIGNIVGPSLKWVRYRMRERSLKGDDDFNAWLQRMAEFMLEDVYAYPYSNFYEVNNTFVLDGFTIGSPVMLVENDQENHRKICIVPHYTENYLMRDWFGDDVAYHRRWKIDNFSAMQAFGLDALPAAIRMQIKQGSYNTKHEYLLCICRAGDPIFQDLKSDYQIPLMRPWMQLWFAMDAVLPNEKMPLNYQWLKDDKKKYVLGADGSKIMLPTSSPGYYHKPFNAWHYARLPHETYSRTPGWAALPDVKGLNAAWRTIHERANREARAATYALETLKGKLKLGAGGVTWVTPQEYDKPPKAFEQAGNYNWAMDFIDRRTKTVGRHFFADLARMIETYSREHKQPPTAYQLSQMISETLILVGPAITSYAGPTLQHVDEQFIEIEATRANPDDPTSSRLWRETNPPQQMTETSGEISPVFVGPLIQGLRISMMAKQIEQPLVMAAPVFEMFPDSKVTVAGKADDLVEYILETGDFPQDCIVPKEERKEALAAMTAERQQAQQLERMAVMADIVPKLQGQTMDKSPLQALEAA